MKNKGLRFLPVVFAMFALHAPAVADHVGGSLHTHLIERGVHSFAQESYRVIQDEVNLRAIFAEIRAKDVSPRPIPEVDFDRFVVVAAFMGERSTTGYSVDFAEKTRQSDDVLFVTVLASSPKPGMLLGGMVTSPYAIASFERGGYDAVMLVDAEGREIDKISLE